MAKAGGMGDVLGSLPLYQKETGWAASVIIPKYDTEWLNNHEFELVFKGSFKMLSKVISFNIVKLKNGVLPFDLYCVDAPKLYFRSSIYLNKDGHGYEDEHERNVAFQRSVLTWLCNGKVNFDLLHCHDHQTGFIPFMIKKCSAYAKLKTIPTMYTIHNGSYNSLYPWKWRKLLPPYQARLNSSLDWSNDMDGVKAACLYADQVNTVSPTYLKELLEVQGPLQYAQSQEPEKFSGILNGIDNDDWNPRTDERLSFHFKRSWEAFKMSNKQEILEGLYQIEDVPLIGFIGRFAYQKGADILYQSIERILGRFGFVNFFVLGSGDKFIENQILDLQGEYGERVAVFIGYNEDLAHKIYAASDFILMPSRFEPCGLNQMFAMRYGAIPVARKTGGLEDTVVDFENGGTGVSFDYVSVNDLVGATARALHLYKDGRRYKRLRSKAAAMDFSWAKSAELYAERYETIVG